MKVFLSWSGQASHMVAEALNEWLPYVIQACRPFISSGDISKGTRWNVALANELQDAQFGIVCVTPYNLFSQWLNYETGALTNAMDVHNVSPFLFSVEPSALPETMSQFQATVCDTVKDPTGKDVFRLVNSLNQKLPIESQISQEVLRNTFARWWPELQERLDKVVPGPKETRTCMSWLLTLQEVVRIREPRPYKVMIVTKNLYKHTLEIDCRNFLQDGLSNNVVFDILYDGKDGGNEDIKQQLLEAFPPSPNPNLHIIPIASLECDHPVVFDHQVVSDCIILIPAGDIKSDPDVYVKVPIEGCENWIRVDGQAASGFRGRFQDLIDSQTVRGTKTQVAKTPKSEA
ncbi:MAG TPA: TIR domain-containing protein [Chthonomonadaceae bacterium]|nr:TIR domain-containing protein [Chthonomonadaceae bacterium]